ncbi:hypothetical protein AGMMS50256_13220 [Betaproteobacteria bacterium]|nr:hypothetical protein AGMMS50256_13220 [Betaproteobacteria bacterium]
MKKSTFSHKSLAVILAAFSTVAFAQFVGPGSQLSAGSGKTAYGTSVTVADILKNPVDDFPVVLQGKLIRKIDKKHYEFTDGTGTIRVEIDRKDFVQQPVDEKTLVELRGKIDNDFMESPEIEIKQMRVIPN